MTMAFERLIIAKTNRISMVLNFLELLRNKLFLSDIANLNSLDADVIEITK